MASSGNLRVLNSANAHRSLFHCGARRCSSILPPVSWLYIFLPADNSL